MNALLKKLVPSLLLFAACSSTAFANTPLAFFWLKNRVLSSVGHQVTIIGAHFDGAFDEGFTQPADCTMNNTGFPKPGNELQFYCKSQDKTEVFGHMDVTVYENGKTDSIPCSYADSNLPGNMLWVKSMPISANVGELIYLDNKLQCVITTL
jgi:hypothetical protein